MAVTHRLHGAILELVEGITERASCVVSILLECSVLSRGNYAPIRGSMVTWEQYPIEYKADGALAKLRICYSLKEADD